MSALLELHSRVSALLELHSRAVPLELHSRAVPLELHSRAVNECSASALLELRSRAAIHPHKLLFITDMATIHCGDSSWLHVYKLQDFTGPGVARIMRLSGCRSHVVVLC